MPRNPLSAGEVRQLSPAQRDHLIDHIDGAVAIVRAGPHLAPVRHSLLKLSLLQPQERGTTRPAFTILTERGRRAVGMILGECADALVRAGLLEQQNPLQVLRELKARLSPDGGQVPAASILGRRGKAHF